MLLELLQKRRSIRFFEERPVGKEKVDALVEAALRSPSSKSKYPWEFIVVDEPEMLDVLSQSKAHGCSFVKKAPLAIVVCADVQKCDVWVEDCSIAALILHLTAADLGLGSCWVQIRKRETAEGEPASPALAKRLGLPEGREVLAFVAIGYPAKSPAGHDRDSLLWERVSHNRSGNRYQ